MKIKDVLQGYLFPSVCIGGLFVVFSSHVFKLQGSRIGQFAFWFYAALIFMETVVRRIGIYQVTDDWLGIFQLTQNPWYVVSAIYNVILFMPFGFLDMVGYGEYLSLRNMIMVAVIFSFGIESLQFLLHIGEAQVLDVMLNAAGAGIGGLVFLEMKRVRNS